MTDTCQQLLAAAQALLAARGDNMITSDDWAALEAAAQACVPREDRPARGESFRVESGALIRTVAPARADAVPYEHVCTLKVFEAVCHAIDELKGEPTALDDLVARTGLPHSQVNTALAFLKERGCLTPARGRRHAAAGGAGGCVHLDAMAEYHALREAGNIP